LGNQQRGFYTLPDLRGSRYDVLIEASFGFFWHFFTVRVSTQLKLKIKNSQHNLNCSILPVVECFISHSEIKWFIINLDMPARCQQADPQQIHNLGYNWADGWAFRGYIHIYI
jgi:hypothetical protein